MNKIDGKKPYPVYDWNSYLTSKEKKKASELFKTIKQNFENVYIGKPILVGTSGEIK